MSTAPNATVRAYLAKQGKKGGINGKGKAKSRGDSAHYRELAHKGSRDSLLSNLTTRERSIYLLTIVGRKV